MVIKLIVRSDRKESFDQPSRLYKLIEHYLLASPCIWLPLNLPSSLLESSLYKIIHCYNQDKLVVLSSYG